MLLRVWRGRENGFLGGGGFFHLGDNVILVYLGGGQK